MKKLLIGLVIVLILLAGGYGWINYNQAQQQANKNVITDLKNNDKITTTMPTSDQKMAVLVYDSTQPLDEQQEAALLKLVNQNVYPVKIIDLSQYQYNYGPDNIKNTADDLQPLEAGLVGSVFQTVYPTTLPAILVMQNNVIVGEGLGWSNEYGDSVYDIISLIQGKGV